MEEAREEVEEAEVMEEEVVVEEMEADVEEAEEVLVVMLTLPLLVMAKDPNVI